MRLGFGRGLLASSHAGTRLPIAVIQDRRRSPLSATARPWMPSAHILPPKNSNKKGALIRAPKENHPNYFPTLALSKSGLWVEGHTFLSACLQAPRLILFCRFPGVSDSIHPFSTSGKRPKNQTPPQGVQNLCGGAVLRFLTFCGWRCPGSRSNPAGGGSGYTQTSAHRN